jgi:hypothetical protein
MPLCVAILDHTPSTVFVAKVMRHYVSQSLTTRHLPFTWEPSSSLPGKCYDQLGDYASAREWLERAVALPPVAGIKGSEDVESKRESEKLLASVRER